MKQREPKRRFVGWPASARFNHATGGRSATFVLMSLALVSFSACRMGPRRANTVSSLPALKYEIDYSAGSPRLAFAPVQTGALRAEDSLAITATLVAAKQLPADSFVPVESQTSMITVFPADRIVAPVARLTKGARIGSVEDAERFIVHLTDQQPDGAVLLQRFHRVLPPEITASFCLLESDPGDSQSPEGIEVQICQRSKVGGGLKPVRFDQLADLFYVPLIVSTSPFSCARIGRILRLRPPGAGPIIVSTCRLCSHAFAVSVVLCGPRAKEVNNENEKSSTHFREQQ